MTVYRDMKLMRKRWPAFCVVQSTSRFVRWRGPLQPISQVYRVEIRYRVKRRTNGPGLGVPEVTVVQPLLRRRAEDPNVAIPHHYPNGKDRELPLLCLYDPAAAEWDPCRGRLTGWHVMKAGSPRVCGRVAVDITKVGPKECGGYERSEQKIVRHAATSPCASTVAEGTILSHSVHRRRWHSRHLSGGVSCRTRAALSRWRINHGILRPDGRDIDGRYHRARTRSRTYVSAGK